MRLEPPYYAVIFTSLLREDQIGYAQIAADMAALAKQQPGYLGMETVHDEVGRGITVSYWQDEVSIRAWKSRAEHLQAQKEGRAKWYASYSVRVAKVERAYDFDCTMDSGTTTDLETP